MTCGRISSLIIATALLLSGCEKPAAEDAQETKPVILCSDMVDGFDDGISFMMLLGSEKTDVRGLSTVTTNVWAQEGLAYGIRMGELCNGQDVTYIAGSQYPLREGRLQSLNAEIDANPGEDASWRGAISYPEVVDWKSFYIDRYGRQPGIAPAGTDAAEYIAGQILSAPGEVTILSIGACTDIAKALTAHPEIASKTKEIIYMGGAVFCPGNTTPYAETNFIYDPESAAICLRAPFPKQTLVSLDVCNTVEMDYDRFMSLYNSIHSDEIKALVRGNYVYQDFQANPSMRQLVWDLIAAAIAVAPDVIDEYRDVKTDVDDAPDSPTYGMTFVTDNAGRRTIRVPLKIDEDRFWNIVTSGLSKF